METTPSTPVRSSEENRLEELYAATTTRNTTGRYIVSLPRTEERRWVSNAQEELKDDPPEDLAIQPFHGEQDEYAIPTLGLLWDPKANNFRVKLDSLPAAIRAKHKVMSYIAQVFEPPDCWPKTTIDQANFPAASEKGRKTVAMTAAQATFFRDLFFSYSRNNKFCRVAAFRNRYRHHLKERAQLRRSGSDTASLSVSSRSKTPPIPPLTTPELHHAEHLICRLAQQETFAEEFLDLANGDRFAKSSALKLLKPSIDEDGIRRIGTRLGNSALSIANKHPIVLLAEHPLSALLASSSHVSLLHAGTTTPASHSPSEVLDPWRQKFCKVRLPPKPHLFPIQAHSSPAEHSRSAGLAGFAVASVYRVWGRLLWIVLREDNRSKSWPYRSLRGHFHLLQSARRNRSWRRRQHQGGQRSASKLAAEEDHLTPLERTVSFVL
nr:uncharacterized protein LOC115267329 [Aedes albopictus]